MKVFVALFAVLGLALATPSNTRDHNLRNDLFELHVITPRDEIVAWLTDKIQNDKDMQAFIGHLMSDHFKTMDSKLLSNTENNFPLDNLSYLFENGLTKAYELANKIRVTIGLPPVEPPVVSKMRTVFLNVDTPKVEWELLHLVEELGKILEPAGPAYQGWYEEKKTDEHVIALYQFISSDKTREYAKWAAEITEVQEFAQMLREGNIPVDQIVEAIKNALGWN